MLKKNGGLFLLGIFCFTFPLACWADEAELNEKIKQLEAKLALMEKRMMEHDQSLQEHKVCFVRQEQKMARYESRLTELDSNLHRQMGPPTIVDEGIRIGVGTTMVIQGTDNVNAADETKSDRTDASFSTDITVQKEFQKVAGRAFVHLEAGRGTALEDELTVYSNVNRDADDDLNAHCTEAWYEQGILNDRILLTFGMLDPTVYFDTNAVANDETTQFLARIFRNSPTLEFPDNTGGIRTGLLPFDWLELQFGLFNATGDWNRVWDSLFNIGQVTLKTKFFGQEGNYRFLMWNNHSHHTKWLDPDKVKKQSFGLGFSLDQEMSEIVTVFSRYGWQDPKVFNPDVLAAGDFNYTLEHSWSTGLQIEGKPWKRENDIFAFAIGQATPSEEYRKVDPLRHADSEGHFEIYYNAHLSDHLTAGPHFQYIWNPFGRDVTEDPRGIAVYGLRAQVDF